MASLPKVPVLKAPDGLSNKWIVLCDCVERVKSFAPTALHYVADVFVGPLDWYPHFKFLTATGKRAGLLLSVRLQFLRATTSPYLCALFHRMAFCLDLGWCSRGILGLCTSIENLFTENKDYDHCMIILGLTRNTYYRLKILIRYKERE